MHLLPAIWTKSLTLLKPEPLIKQVLIILSSTEPLRELRFTAHSFTGLVYCASFYEHRYPERQAAATGENRNLKLAQEDACIRSKKTSSDQFALRKPNDTALLQIYCYYKAINKFNFIIFAYKVWPLPLKVGTFVSDESLSLLYFV